MVYTLGEASRAVGLSKSAISKAIKTGRLSATKDDLGQYRIDPAELHRVFPLVSVNGQPEQDSTRQETPVDPKLTALSAKVESLQEQLTREREWSRELSRRLDEEAAERRKLTALLTHQPEPARPSFWRWLLGGR